MIRQHSFRHATVAALLLLASPAALGAQTAPLTPDIPATFSAPTGAYDDVKARQRIYHGPGAASFIDLPVVPVG